MKYINNKKIGEWILNKINERKFKYIAFFWLLISIQFVLGANLQYKGYSVKSLNEFIVDIIKVVVLNILFVLVHYLTLKCISHCKGKNKSYKKIGIKIKEIYDKYLVFVIIVICWIPALLSFYPALVCYDGGYQIRDCFFNLGFNLGHPIVCSVFYTLFYRVGVYVFKSGNIGMFLFSVFQMIFMASIFTYAIKFIEKETEKKWLKIICIVFYALFPYNQLLSISTTKDVIFSGFLILFIIGLYKSFNKKCTVVEYCYLILIGILMLIFRSNAKYALLGTVPFVILILLKSKDKIKQFLIIIVISVLVSTSLNNFLINMVKKDDYSELAIYCIFTQAIAKITKEEILTEEEKNQVSKYFGDYNELARVYLPNLADNTTNMLKQKELNSGELNKKEFYEISLKLMKKYPRITIESYLNTIRGFWYINDKTFGYSDDAEKQKVSGVLELYTFIILNKKEYKVSQKSVLPQLRDFYRKLFCENKYLDIPILYVLFQPALYFYLLIAYLLYNIYKRNKIETIIGVYLFLYFLTFFIGPCSIVRYIYPNIVSMPILAGFILKKKEL